MTDTDIHSCGYYCDRPACLKAQRDELRDKLFEGQAVKTYSGGKPNYTQPDEALMKRVMDGIPDMPIKVQDEPYNPLENNFNYERGFIDGQQKQMESAVHRAVDAMKKEWVGLTDEEINVVVKSCNTTDTYKYFRSIEAKLKEKNGG